MSIQTTEYINVKERARELGTNIPTGLAFLPINFDTANSKDELVYEDSTLTIRKLWRKAAIEETRIEKEGEKIPYEQRKSLELALPTVFVSFSLISQDPTLISIALNVISNYATDFFKGIAGEKKITIDLVVEQNEKKKSKRIHYEGDINGLNKLSQIIKELKDL
jgi:hypothetical protein